MGTTEQTGVRSIDPKLLEILACPVTKSSLIYDKAAQELISRGANLAFPIRDGIPILLVEEARDLTDDEREAIAPRPSGQADPDR